MNLDLINFIIRCITLMVLGATIELAIDRKQIVIGAFLTAVWLSNFRLAILRAILIGIGVLQHQNIQTLSQMEAFFRSGAVASVPDVSLLVTTILLFHFIGHMKRAK